jgi:Cu-Zn family superoxide dismutase
VERVILQGATPSITNVAMAIAELKDVKGQTVGRADLISTPNGVLIRLRLTNAQSGVHAIHIHATGKCDAPSFESAGPHFDPNKAPSGFIDAKGPHAGDLPNLHIPQNGTLEIEVLADAASLSGANGVLDADGAALVLHADADDYKTDPAGNSGERIACGVITREADNERGAPGARNRTGRTEPTLRANLPSY